MTDDSDRKPKNPLGPTGDRVMTNVKQLRQSQGLTYKQLADRLESLGRPIPVLGLSRLERGERRVDVDDLIALAIALGTTPNRLLLPQVDIEHAEESYRLTPAIRETPLLLWAWATGEVPLGRLPASAASDRTTRAEEIAFTRENQPHHWMMRQWAHPPGPPIGAGVIALTGITVSVGEAVRQNFNTDDIRAMVGSAIAAALRSPDPSAGETRVEIAEDGHVIVRLNASDSSAGGEQQEHGQPDKGVDDGSQ